MQRLTWLVPLAFFAFSSAKAAESKHDLNLYDALRQGDTDEVVSLLLREDDFFENNRPSVLYAARVISPWVIEDRLANGSEEEAAKDGDNWHRLLLWLEQQTHGQRYFVDLASELLPVSVKWPAARKVTHELSYDAEPNAQKEALALARTLKNESAIESLSRLVDGKAGPSRSRSASKLSKVSEASAEEGKAFSRTPSLSRVGVHSVAADSTLSVHSDSGTSVEERKTKVTERLEAADALVAEREKAREAAWQKILAEAPKANYDDDELEVLTLDDEDEAPQATARSQVRPVTAAHDRDDEIPLDEGDQLGSLVFPRTEVPGVLLNPAKQVRMGSEVFPDSHPKPTKHHRNPTPYRHTSESKAKPRVDTPRVDHVASSPAQTGMPRSLSDITGGSSTLKINPGAAKRSPAGSPASRASELASPALSAASSSYSPGRSPLVPPPSPLQLTPRPIYTSASRSSSSSSPGKSSQAAPLPSPTRSGNPFETVSTSVKYGFHLDVSKNQVPSPALGSASTQGGKVSARDRASSVGARPFSKAALETLKTRARQ